MAGTEGSGQTELLSGWSCVVHRPSEDPEPSELPSTVDMAAFTSGISVEPTQNANNEDSCDSESDSESDSNNSVSDGSGSCSQSDSSDSESSSSSQESTSRSSSPEFSVTSSQTDGLRLKIATVRKSCTSPVEKVPKVETKPPSTVKTGDKISTTKDCATVSSSSEDSQCTGGSSESSTDSEMPKSDTILKTNEDKNASVKKPTKVVSKPVDKAEKRTTRGAAVMSPTKLSAKGKTRPTKRARKIASLPLSHGSTCSSSDSEDGSETDRTMLASCSLQEIRQEDLAAILPDQQECDAFADFDCRDDKDSPHTGDGSGSDMELPQQAVNALILRTTESSSESESRLPPNPNTLYANSFLQQFVAQTQLLSISNSTSATISDTSLPNSTQSTDSNLTSTNDLSSTKRKRGRPKKVSSLKSLVEDFKIEKPETNIEYCGNPNVSPDSGIQNSSDHVSSPEPCPSPNPKTKYIKEEIVTKNSNIIRIKGPITSNSFDRVHYGNADRVLYPPRRKAGRPVARKGPGRPPKHRSVSATLQEINPTKNADTENSLNRISTKSEKVESKSKSKNYKSSGNTPAAANLETKPKIKDFPKKSKAPLLQDICDKVSKRLASPQCSENGKSQRKSTKKHRIILGSKNKLECLKTKYATLKNAKVMHSKHKDKRHKKCKFKILKPISTTPIDLKINSEIDKLVIDFVKLCNIGTAKPSKENVPEIWKALKKVSKKRKTSEYSERKKKKQSVNSSFNKDTSCNEQRLPLKKRHYHLSTNDSTTTNPQITAEPELKPTISEKDPKSCNMSTKTIYEKPKSIIRSNSVSEQHINAVLLPKSTNNNDYTNANKPKSATVDVHINEAIEACITKYALVPEPAMKSIRSPKPTRTELCKTEPPKPTKAEPPKTKIEPPKPTKNEPPKHTNIELLKPTKMEPPKPTKTDPPKPTKIDLLKSTKMDPHKPTKIDPPKSTRIDTPKPTKIDLSKPTRIDPPKPTKIYLSKPTKIEPSKPTQIEIPKPTKIELPKPTKIDTPKPTKTELKPIKSDPPTIKSDISKPNKAEGTKTEIKPETLPIKQEEKVNTPPLTTTTPKKRHRLDVKTKIEDVPSITDIIELTLKNDKQALSKSLERVVSELKAKKSTSAKVPTHEKRQEHVAHVITRKKNRLEDLTLTLANKVNSNLLDETSDNNQKRKKYDFGITKKVKPLELEKLDAMISDEPTGIFMPTVDMELELSSASPTVDLSKVKLEDFPIVNVENMPFRETSVVLIKTEVGSMLAESPRKKIRKRRPYNRTGFPTVKRKKKRILSTEIPLLIPDGTQVVQKVEERTVCDRVPQEGEKYSAFLQRTEKHNVADAILEKLQKCIVSTPNLTEQQIAKWNEEESMYELGIHRNGRPSSRLSMKQCRSKDVSPSLSIETLSSDKYTDGELDELSLEDRLELLKGNKYKTDMRIKSLRYSSLQKRRLRDISPASSSETYDKRFREEVSVSGDEGKRPRRVTKWRKKFLVAGLFSDYYKEDDETAKLRRTENTSKRQVYKPEEHPYGLMPPPHHCGKFIRCRRSPFMLPYDLWWQHFNSQLPGRDMVPSWNYRKIRTNFYNVKNNGGACESQACNCSSESQCGDDCINRLVLAECPATHKCLNQRIQKHDWSPGIEKFMTVDKGWGVRTKLPIKSGEFILEYVGEVVSDNEFKERMASRYANDIHHYCLHLDGGLVIDGHRMGGYGRFVNHSCEPNCEIQKWSVNGQFRMALFALRDIESCEELTYDYNFSLFNPAEGQECKCGSNNCRGVIGGKTQRVVRQSAANSPVPTPIPQIPGRLGRPRKKKAQRAANTTKETPAPSMPILPLLSLPASTPAPVAKPLNNLQKSYVREHHCFLLRNMNKSKPNRMSISLLNTPTPSETPATFLNHVNALRLPRNIKTRRLAQVEDDPELKKAAKLAGSLKDLLNVVMQARDEKNQLLCSSFVTLPSKRKCADYYQRILEPIDLTTIERNVTAGNYLSIENFDSDLKKVFTNGVKYFGRTSELGICAARLRKIYCEAKKVNFVKLEEQLGEKLPASFLPTKKRGDEEDVIRCICGMYHDEGLMIQCERCLVWQHSECVCADAKTPSYHCERCVPRDVNYEIALEEFTEHGHRYYMTLLRADLQLRQGDTVYVLRDITIPGTKRKHTYKTIGEIKYADLDIFRIERLWKDSKTGQRFAYGHHYLRPHETFHEPTRKFFSNEVMRVPLYEAVPVELVISHCWVLDINTFCKGRPIGAPEEHIYICEYRVDKSARLFMKNSKAKYPVCTKSYAFEKFNVRLKISRTYAPHDLDPAFVKPRGRKALENENVKEIPQLPIRVPPVIRTLSEKKTRLNKILLNLLNKMPTKQALDVSYLLEGGRRRKRPVDK